MICHAAPTTTLRAHIDGAGCDVPLLSCGWLPEGLDGILLHGRVWLRPEAEERVRAASKEELPAVLDSIVLRVLGR